MNIAIIGYGVVGSGVYEVIKENASILARKCQKDINIKYILDIRDFDNHCEKEIFTKNFEDILNDDSVEIVVETVGGKTFAYEYTKKLLMAGKSMVTSNKELVATYGDELLKIAREKNVRYLFEASVGGGIPIIRPLVQCLAGNKINKIEGILNGTTNYILTKMFKDGQSFDDALIDAQKLGYAERDASADVDGLDTCRKIAILTSLSYGFKINADKIPTEGIRNITKEDVSYAEKFGYSIKLIGYSNIYDSGVNIRVCPMLVSKESPVSAVEDVFNAVLVNGNEVDDVMFYGRGAGKLPTASAVVGDVVDIAQTPKNTGKFFWETEKENSILPKEDEKFSRLVRIENDKKDICKKVFGADEFYGINDECAFISSEISEKDFDIFCKKVGGVISSVRVLK